MLAGYFALAVLFTFPLVAHMSSRVLDPDGDPSIYMWAFWWARKSLFTRGLSGLHSDWMLYPIGADLVLNASVWLKAYAFIPLQALFGLPFAYNFSILFALTVSAYGMAKLVAHLTGDELTGIVMGVFFGFCPYLLMRSRGHLNFVSAEWIPFYVLFLLRSIESAKRNDAIAAGLMLALVGYCDYSFLIYCVLIGIVVFFFHLKKMPVGRLAKSAAILGGSFVVFFSPILVPLLRFSLRRREAPSGWLGADIYSADLLSYVSPAPTSTFLGRWSLSDRFTGNAMESTLYVGAVLLALFVVSLYRYFRRNDSVRLHAYLALVFFVLSLGPILHVKGKSAIDFDGLKVSLGLPFILLHYAGLLRDLRVPGRFGIVTMLAIVVVASFSVRALLQRFEIGRAHV